MLARRPSDGWASDGNPRNASWQRLEFGVTSPQAATGSLAWHVEVDIKHRKVAHRPVHHAERDRDVDPILHAVRHQMHIYRHHKTDQRNKVLDDKELVIPSSDWRKRTEDNPYQDTPGSKAPFSDRVGFELDRDKIVWCPIAEPESHVYRDRQQQDSRCPAMDPIQPLVARSCQDANHVVLSSQDED